MKIIDTWDVPVQKYKRFVVISRGAESIILEDIERGRCYRIVLENVTEYDNLDKWSDVDWWNLLFLRNHFC